MLEGTRSGLAALGHLARWPLPVDTAVTVVQRERRDRWRARLTQDWDPALSFELLADYGVPVVDTRVAHSVDEALTAAAAVGYPVVLKTLAAQHKSEVGGVIAGPGDEAALRSAYTAMARALGAAVTVSAMVDGEPRSRSASSATTASVRWWWWPPAARWSRCSPTGGGLPTGVTRRRDAAARRAAHASDARRLAGRPAADIDALADVIVRFSELAVELGDALDAVEANPSWSRDAASSPWTRW